MKHGTAKMVTALGHSFDCLPAHVQISGRGSASTVRVAVARAVENIFNDPQLKRKHVGSFKVSVAINHAEVANEK